MKRLLLFALLLAVLVAPVVALQSNFQDWDKYGFQGSYYWGTDTLTAGSVSLTPDTVNMVSVHSLDGDPVYLASSIPTPYAYAAFDIPYVADPACSGVCHYGVYLLDTSGHTITSITSPPFHANSRYEMKLVGGSPQLYENGTLVETAAPITTDPYYVAYIFTQDHPLGAIRHPIYIHNAVVGETADHRAISSLPNNWTVLRDVLTPTATGVYAWNPSLNVWVLKNSDTFYIDADKESMSAEDLIIRYQTGDTVNTTSLTGVHNVVAYNVPQFLNTTSSLGSALPDGRYSVGFSGSNVIEYFWVQSAGAVVTLDKEFYHIGDTATATYTITPSYYDTTIYDYSWKFVDIFGNELSTGALSSSSGTFSATTETYSQGVIYVEIVATRKSDSNAYILGFDAAEMLENLYMNGYVMDAETGAVISGAMVNITQGSVFDSSASAATGFWNSTVELTADTLSIATAKAGYTSDLRSFTPLSSKTIYLNISLLSVTPAYSGVTIGGIVRDDVFGNPIPSATVTIRNTTFSESYTNSSNIAGYYRQDSLMSGRWYDVWSTKTGYSDSVHHMVQAVGV